VNIKTTNKILIATDRFKTPNSLVPTINKTSKNDANVESEDDNNDDLNAFKYAEKKLREDKPINMDYILKHTISLYFKRV
jgi:hypothetical protein